MSFLPHQIIFYFVGKPRFSNFQNSIQFGYLNNASILEVNVFADPQPVKIEWLDANKLSLSGNRFIFSENKAIVSEKVNNDTTYLEGYTYRLTITKTEESDFQNYTIQVKNRFGQTCLAVYLRHAGIFGQ